MDSREQEQVVQRLYERDDHRRYPRRSSARARAPPPSAGSELARSGAAAVVRETGMWEKEALQNEAQGRLSFGFSFLHIYAYRTDARKSRGDSGRVVPADQRSRG